MAKLVRKKIQFNGSREAGYDWKAWIDGQTRQAVKGIDFTVEASAFRSSIYAAARRLGKKAETRIKGDTVFFRFIDPSTKTQTP